MLHKFQKNKLSVKDSINVKGGRRPMECDHPDYEIVYIGGLAYCVPIR